MGTKLSNINLYNPYGAEYVLEKGFCSKNIVEGWDTILNDGEGYDFLGMLKQAKKLSKELGTTAVYTNYFDDSELVRLKWKKESLLPPRIISMVYSRVIRTDTMLITQ